MAGKKIEKYKGEKTKIPATPKYILTYIHTYMIFTSLKFLTFFPMIPGGYTTDIMGKKTTTTIIIIILLWHFEM
jgi:hypothetical protein